MYRQLSVYVWCSCMHFCVSAFSWKTRRSIRTSPVHFTGIDTFLKPYKRTPFTKPCLSFAFQYMLSFSFIMYQQQRICLKYLNKLIYG